MKEPARAHGVKYDQDEKTYRGTVTPGGFNWGVTVDGLELNSRRDLHDHSPDGFSWGYWGSGPAQLSLAILADAFGDEFALRHYQDFKIDVIGKINKDSNFTLTEEQLKEWRKRTNR